eukprot:TRINITY_DN1213_c0_g1_i2.p1 TRINITY_DN1213_c0_g1~~TRINITY_DN1213_c0_g1_i2.p1  ORF type:complete len:797 (+),score=175.56 TRINITY_DN1213_c0_g1_i2:81-2471(+)
MSFDIHDLNLPSDLGSLSSKGTKQRGHTRQRSRSIGENERSIVEHRKNELTASKARGKRLLNVKFPENQQSSVVWIPDTPLRDVLERLAKQRNLILNHCDVFDSSGKLLDVNLPLKDLNVYDVVVEANAKYKKRLERLKLTKTDRTSDLSGLVYRDKAAEEKAEQVLVQVLAQKEVEERSHYNIFTTQKPKEQAGPYGLKWDECQKSESKIPHFIEKAMDRLISESTSLSSKSAWSCMKAIPKNLHDVITLGTSRKAIESGTLTIDEIPDLRTVVALLMLFFELSYEPLIPFPLFKLMISTREITDQKWKLSILQDLILQLSPVQRRVLAFMCKNLDKLSAVRNSGKAGGSGSLQHLAHCFGPLMLVANETQIENVKVAKLGARKSHDLSTKSQLGALISPRDIPSTSTMTNGTIKIKKVPSDKTKHISIVDDGIVLDSLSSHGEKWKSTDNLPSSNLPSEGSIVADSVSISSTSSLPDLSSTSTTSTTSTGGSSISTTTTTTKKSSEESSKSDIINVSNIVLHQRRKSLRTANTISSCSGHEASSTTTTTATSTETPKRIKILLNLAPISKQSDSSSSLTNDNLSSLTTTNSGSMSARLYNTKPKILQIDTTFKASETQKNEVQGPQTARVHTAKHEKATSDVKILTPPSFPPPPASTSFSESHPATGSSSSSGSSTGSASPKVNDTSRNTQEAIYLCETLITHYKFLFELESDELKFQEKEDKVSIQSGSLNALVDKLISENYKEPDYSSAFFACFEYFVTAETLLSTIISKFPRITKSTMDDTKTWILQKRKR